MFKKVSVITIALAMTALMSFGLYGCGGGEDEGGPVGGGAGHNVGGGPASVNLGSSAHYAILAKAGVTNSSPVGTVVVTGDIGVSPIGFTALVGFSPLTPADTSQPFSTSELVAGKLYAADYLDPTPANLTAAVGDMETAYTTAAGLVAPAVTVLTSGDLAGLTLAPGIYKWSGVLGISTPGVTLAGGPDDTWVFQVEGGLTQAAATEVKLTGGAQAKNIIWQSGGAVTIASTAKMEGNILSFTTVALADGAQVHGRIFSQTNVTLLNSIVKKPN